MLKVQKKKTKETVRIIRACIVDGEPVAIGDEVTIDLVDARYLVSAGKAAPMGDNREADAKKVSVERARADAKSKKG